MNLTNRKTYTFLVTIILFYCIESFPQGKVENVDFTTITEGEIAIVYELKNFNEEDNFEIEVYFTRKSDSTFLMVPENLSGDIGKMNSLFGQKRIIWKMTQDEINQLKSLQADDFQVIVNPVSIMAWYEDLEWYHYPLGVAGAAGIAYLIYIILKPEEPPKKEPIPIIGAPPVRP